MNLPPSPLKAAQFLNHRYQEVLQQDLNSTPEIIHQSNQERNMVQQNQSDIYSEFKDALATLNRRYKPPNRIRGTRPYEPFAKLQSNPETSFSAQINQTIKEEKQQKRVETIAPLLVDYLNLNRTSKISKSNFSIEYNPDERTIIFENHKNPSEKLKAQLQDDRWVDRGSSISQSEESRFVERVAPKLKKAFLEQQHQSTRPKTYRKTVKNISQAHPELQLKLKP